MDSRLSRFEHFSGNALALLFIASLIATCYFAATVQIAAVPRDVPFGFVMALPYYYWFALGLAVTLAFVAAKAGQVRYLWAASIILAVLVSGLGDLTQTYPRDTFSTSAVSRISRIGSFDRGDNPFLSFPGSAIIFSSLAVVTGLTPVAVVRAFGLAYNIIVILLAYAAFRRLGIGETQALLGALAVVFGFYYQGLVIFTTLTGFLLYVMIFGLVLGPYPNRAITTLLLIIFFSSMAVSHAFSPFLTLSSLGVMLLGWGFGDRILRRLKLMRLRGDPPIVSRSVLLPLAAVLVIYWIYFASLPFSWGIINFVATDPLTLLRSVVSPVASPQTVYARSYASIARLYAPVFFSAFTIFLVAVHDRRKLQLLLWLLGLAASMTIAVSGYVEEFLARIFAFAILPFSYAIARLFMSDRSLLRAIALGVLLAAMALHLPSHYGQDSFEVVQDATVKALQFFSKHSSLTSSLDSPARELRERYYVDAYRTDQIASTFASSYYLLSYQAESWALYSGGEDYLSKVMQNVQSNHYSTVYSNGSFNIYFKN